MYCCIIFLIKLKNDCYPFGLCSYVGDKKPLKVDLAASTDDSLALSYARSISQQVIRPPLHDVILSYNMNLQYIDIIGHVIL